jgi:hypothetical protein
VHVEPEGLAESVLPATLTLVLLITIWSGIGYEALRGLHLVNEIARRQLLAEREDMKTRQLWMLIEIWYPVYSEAACRA